MNQAKLQIDLFKELVKTPERVRYTKLGEYICFTPDIYSGFSLPTNQVCIDLRKAQEIPSLKEHFEVTKKDREVSATNIYVQCASCIARKLKSDTFSVYVDKSLFDRYYSGQEIYCESPISPVKLVSDNRRVEAVIMPVLGVKED